MLPVPGVSAQELRAAIVRDQPPDEAPPSDADLQNMIQARREQPPRPGIVSLLVALVTILVAILAAVVLVTLLLVMLGLFLAPPFGTLAYLAIWFFFARARRRHRGVDRPGRGHPLGHPRADRLGHRNDRTASNFGRGSPGRGSPSYIPVLANSRAPSIAGASEPPLVALAAVLAAGDGLP